MLPHSHSLRSWPRLTNVPTLEDFEAQTLCCSDRVHGLCRGFAPVDAKLWYNNHQAAKYAEFYAKQLRKPSDLLPKTFVIQTSNSVHWEVKFNL
jgi:hypothetical protein